jgi:hypothetical protein
MPQPRQRNRAKKTTSSPPPAATRTPATAATQSAARRRRDEVAELRARVAQLEHTESPQRGPDPKQLAKDFEGWPREGYDGPPPWEVAAAHAEDRHTRADQPDPYRGPGAVTHSEPLLTEGAAGDAVARLAELLKVLGYRDNTIARGENPANVLDQSVMHDVVAFARSHNVGEDLESFRGLAVPAEDAVQRVIGPYTWQALYAAAERRAQEAISA